MIRQCLSEILLFESSSSCCSSFSRSMWTLGIFSRPFPASSLPSQGPFVSLAQGNLQDNLKSIRVQPSNELLIFKFFVIAILTSSTCCSSLVLALVTVLTLSSSAWRSSITCWCASWRALFSFVSFARFASWLDISSVRFLTCKNPWFVHQIWQWD